MTFHEFIQYGGSIAALIALLWVVAGLIASAFPDPKYEDEHETMNGPGLPHHRSKK